MADVSFILIFAPFILQTFLVWQLAFSTIIGRSYSFNQIAGCLLVATGVVVAVARYVEGTIRGITRRYFEIIGLTIYKSLLVCMVIDSIMEDQKLDEFKHMGDHFSDIVL